MNERRDFFRAIKKPVIKEEAILRPPYGFGESLFQSECPKCETKDCQTHCEEQIIVIKADGTPTINLTKRGCTFCDECAKMCQKGVLSLENLQTKDRLNARFTIMIESCMAHQKTICFSCKEPCLDDAILFNGMFNPVIDDSRCTACGFCMSRCPTNAISFEVTKIKESKDES